MKHALLAISIAVVVVACHKQENENVTTTNGSTAPAFDAKDREFITKAAENGKAEVDLAQFAAAHATSRDVKAFAQKLIDDHKKANDDLAAIAARKGVTTPVEPKPSETTKALQSMTGRNFDQGYVMQMIQDHQNAVKLFESASKDAADPDVKNFAAATLPVLQQHLEMAQDLESKVGGKKKTP